MKGIISQFVCKITSTVGYISARYSEGPLFRESEASNSDIKGIGPPEWWAQGHYKPMYTFLNLNSCSAVSSL
jgi:hypothetical protein